MLLYWIWFAQLQGIPLWQKRELLQYFADPEELFFLREALPSSALEMNPKLPELLCDRDLTQAEKILNQCRRKGIRLLTYGDPAYPDRLRTIQDPPMVLYYKGTLPDWDAQPVIGLVGTRKASAYGLQVARQLGEQISDCGATVISGGASGADTKSMEGALDRMGKVVCVLGCGVDVIYPRTNRRLFSRTEERGCLLSEYPPQEAALGWHFLQRNRIISGISNGVVIVEAPEKSGALNTAKHALEQGRDLYAVPANIGVMTAYGSNQLLLEKAQAVLSGWDVVKNYAHLYPDTVHKPGERIRPVMEDCQAKVAQNPIIPEKLPKKVIDNWENTSYSELRQLEPALNQEEQAVLALLTGQPLHPDAVAARSDLPAGKVQSILTKLAVKGLVQLHPGGRVSLKSL